MRILFITNFFPPASNGGTEKRTFGYASKLKEAGHDVQVLCAGQWTEGEHYWNGFIDEIYQEIPIRRVNLNWNLAQDPNRFLYFNPFIQRILKDWLEEWRPDIVHITSCQTLSASVILAAKERGLPIVLTLTDFWFICPRMNLLHANGSLCDGRTTIWNCTECMLWGTKAQDFLVGNMSPKITAASLMWISRHPVISSKSGLRGMAINMKDRKSLLPVILEMADRVIAPSNFLSGRFWAAGITKPIVVIYSGHDLSWLKAMPEKTPSKIIRFAYIGQISQHKGVHILVEAFRSHELNGRANLSIYGDFEQSEDYAKKIKNLADDRGGIFIKGSFSPDKLGEIFSEIDVLVVPSHWHENNPRVIQEAFAAKIPVIATNVGGINEFVHHQVNGLLFERGSTEDLKDKLHQVVNNPGLIDQLKAGIPEVRTMESEISEIMAVYKDLTGG